MKIGTKKLFAATLCSLTAAVCANAQNLNGTLNTSFYGSPVYVQTINTGFGDAAGNDAVSGGELDAVYTHVANNNLYIFIAGAVQGGGSGGNPIVVFVAGGAAGQNTLNIPNTTSMSGLNGSVFYPGFQATWAYSVDDFNGTLYSDEYTLTGTPTGGYVGSLAESSTGIAAGSDGTTGVASIYLNNNLVSGMGAANAALTAGPNTGANTTTGLELVVPLADIGYTGGSIGILVCYDNGGYSYLSNQFLPGLPVGTGNLGTPTFNFGSTPTPTNYVTFQLDMSEQVAFGNFVNTDPSPDSPTYGQYTNSVAVGTTFNGFGTSDQLTNYTILNPGDLNPGLKTNLYIGTFPFVSFLPATFQWKYRVNNLDGGYEQPASTAGGNRITAITQTDTVLPVLFYDDLGLGDLVVSNTLTMNFSIFCTNGTVDNGGNVFTKGNDQIFIAGPSIGSGYPSSWGVGSLPPDQQMIEVGTSDVYTNSFVVNRGTSIYQNYKYSFDGLDDENGFATNHVREIRSYGPTYTFPQDVWSYSVLQPNNGNPYPLAGLAVTNIVEPDFGNLKIGAPSSGNLPITWLGRPAVLLQNANSLTGTWNTLSGTDATESTNWPNAGKAQFFRLMKE